MGSLIFQLVPFQTESVRTGPYDINYEYRRNGRSFNIGFGVTSVRPGLNFESTGFNVRVGYRKWTRIAQNWSYFRGIDAMSSSKGFNRPIDVNSIYSTAGLGLPLGIQFHISDDISLWTESIFFVGFSHEVDFGDFSPIQIIPPLSIHLSAKL